MELGGGGASRVGVRCDAVRACPPRPRSVGWGERFLIPFLIVRALKVWANSLNAIKILANFLIVIDPRVIDTKNSFNVI